MTLYKTNVSSPSKLPLIGCTLERWTDPEYGSELPGYHIMIEWYRVKWLGSCDLNAWEMFKPMCYRHSICFEFNWPRIWWR